MTEPIPCKFCPHDYDSHNPDAADGQRNMPCTECPDGTCRPPGQSETPAGTLRRAAQLMRDSASGMRPGVGQAGAELFDAAADAYETGEPWWGYPLPLARVLLDGTEPTP